METKKRIEEAVVSAAFGGKCPCCGGRHFASSVFSGIRTCCSCGSFVSSVGIVPAAVDFAPVPFFGVDEVDNFVGAFAECA